MYHPAYILRDKNQINAVSAHNQLISDCLANTLAEPSQPSFVRTRTLGVSA
jgi:hypothetical protein